MNDIDRELKRLASICTAFRDIRTKEERTLACWISFYQSSLEVIDKILSDQSIGYKQLIKLERIINLITHFIADYATCFDVKYPKQRKARDLYDMICERKEIVKEKKQEHKISKTEYQTLDEWIDEKNILKLANSRRENYRNGILLPVNYESEYSLFVDMRELILHKPKNGILDNEAYMYKISKELEGELELDLKSGKLKTSIASEEILSMVRLIKKNPYFQPAYINSYGNWYYEKIIEEIEHETKLKTLMQVQ